MARLLPVNDSGSRAKPPVYEPLVDQPHLDLCLWCQTTGWLRGSSGKVTFEELVFLLCSVMGCQQDWTLRYGINDEGADCK